MATNKFYKLVVYGCIVMAILMAAAMLSCDKRNAVSSPENGGGVPGISNILVSLNPNQLRLASRDAIDTVQVLIAVVDSNGVGVPKVQVHVTRTPSIGFLTQPDSTDDMGQTRALFVAEPGVYDTTRIKVNVGNIIQTALLAISGPTRYTLNLTFSPPIPKLIDHEAAPYTITGNLVDSTQRGVSGQQVIFAVLNQVGRIGFSDPNTTVPVTNSQGLVEALFYNTETDEIMLPDTAVIQAVTRAPSGSGFLSADVKVPLRPVHNSLTLQATPSTIVGDGASSVSIRAFLLDTDGHGIVGDTVKFSNPTHDGYLLANAITDANGIATNNFTPFAGRDTTIITRIVADYKAGSPVHQAISTVNVTVSPIRSIGFITLSLQKQNVVANAADSSAIFITVQDSTGGLIADGTIIHLEHSGIGVLSAPQVTTTDGQARAKITGPANINGGPSTKVDTITVWGNVTDSTVIKASAVVNYIPGNIFQMAFVSPDSTVNLVAGSGDTCSVWVLAVDVNGNPVANGTQISFRNTPVISSSLTPQAAGTFDGYARSIYLVGSGTGDDNVTAWITNPTNANDTIRTVHPIVFRCLSSSATTLELSASQTNIEVGGTSTQIIATLQDAYGNPLSEGYWVSFDITVSPGADPIDKPSFDTQQLTQHDTVATNINGQAILQLYSGRRAGAVSIRACTVPLPPESLFVCNEKSLVTISSGPPDHINFAFSSNGEAEPPARFVQVGAVVGDRFSNDVQYGTAVYFSLIPNDRANIEGDSYTGGARQYHPDSTAGVAYTRIIYGCLATFKGIQVIASSAGDSIEVVDTSGTYTLPIFEGEIGLMANPGALWTPNQNQTSTDTAFITASLIDGGGCAIEGGIITFVAQVAGEILPPSTDTTDVNGLATCRFVIHGNQIPRLPDGRATIDAGVKATLMQKTSVFSVINITCSTP